MQDLFRSATAWENYLSSPEGEFALYGLYPRDTAKRARYLRVVKGFSERFCDAPIALVSAPGRTELSGNHTDHQRGRVLAAAVTLDIVAAVCPNKSGTLRLCSEGYGEAHADIHNPAPHESEKNTTAALLRGVAAGLSKAGYCVGGFDAYLQSDVPQGSGLSSSAALEVLLGSIHNLLYNAGNIPALEIAKAGQYAENVYFGKPCGLMDQSASALGGVHCIDFANPSQPLAQQVPCDFETKGFTLYVVNAGGSHANLTPEYASIPGEMRAVAAQFQHETLNQVDEEAFRAELPLLRGKVPDRALLRALHFFEENRRVLAMADALRKSDMELYRLLMLESGNSSMGQLQNIYPASSEAERSVSLALALARDYLHSTGAWRIHGGGFAGTIQALVPHKHTVEFERIMQSAFGVDSCFALAVRPAGGYALGQHSGGMYV